jgi:hypothetical protein
MAAAEPAGSRGPRALGDAPGLELPPAATGSAEPGGVEPGCAEPVSRSELNAWRRGFTPQAEIWNGRLAMLGLSVGLTVLLVARLATR